MSPAIGIAKKKDATECINFVQYEIQPFYYELPLTSFSLWGSRQSDMAYWIGIYRQIALKSATPDRSKICKIFAFSRSLARPAHLNMSKR